eukprot:6190791-Pleurochrysis_carterae.AAC.1
MALTLQLPTLSKLPEKYYTTSVIDGITLALARCVASRPASEYSLCLLPWKCSDALHAEGAFCCGQGDLLEIEEEAGAAEARPDRLDDGECGGPRADDKL